MTPVGLFLSGMVTMGFMVAAMFFLRFWQQTRDRLFLAFGMAFGLFATNQALVALSFFPREDQSLFYAMRFAGFAILIAAIVAKNLEDRGPRSH